MTKLEKMIRNYGTRFTLTTNTLKKYYENDLIDSNIVFSEIPNNKTISCIIQDQLLIVCSPERNMPNGDINIINENLLDIFRNN